MDFLKGCGISEFTYDHKPALRMPYLGAGRRGTGGPVPDLTRWRSLPLEVRDQAMPLRAPSLGRGASGRDRWSWSKGSSDCHTLWYHGIAALGVPGAANWREERDAQHLEGIETIYVVIEADRGGEAVRQWLSRSAIRHRVKLLSLPEKDPSAMHIQGPETFLGRWRIACLGAVPWTAVEAEASAAERTEAWTVCADLARRPRILDEFDTELARLGLVGERRAAKLLFLALVSRLLRAAGVGRGQGTVLGRQVVRRRDRAEVLSAARPFTPSRP